MAFRYMVLKNGWLIFNYGTGIANFRASTGRPGVSDPSIENIGPIPPGRYIIIPSEISDVDYRKYKEGTLQYEKFKQDYILRNWVGDWEYYRVKLHPQKLMYPNRDGHRSEFFLHGGKNLGSAGCIDVGNQDAELFSLIERTNTNDVTDNILVEVTEHPNKEGWENLKSDFFWKIYRLGGKIYNEKNQYNTFLCFLVMFYFSDYSLDISKHKFKYRHI